MNLSLTTIDDGAMVGDPASDVRADAAVASGPRRIAVDAEGVLRSLHGDPIGIATDQLFAVLVLWSEDSASSWLGWLTTNNHCSTSFTALDLEDPLVARWLGDLAGWDRLKLSLATKRPGFHLVWRRGE